MELNQWHNRLPGNEFDYLALMGALQEYKRPRDKVSKLLQRGEIIRVKKGLYILGPSRRKHPGISREILGNQIYGPSYLSLEYALSWHQLIPERVETVTSVTLHKSKSYSTPVGHFTYRHVKHDYYSYGIDVHILTDGRGFLLASPEKAIADQVYFVTGLTCLADMQSFLFADLRLDRDELRRLNRKFFKDLSALENKSSLRLLSELIQAHS